MRTSARMRSTTGRLLGGALAVAVGVVGGGLWVGHSAPAGAQLAESHLDPIGPAQADPYPGASTWIVDVTGATTGAEAAGPALPGGIAVDVPDPVAVLSRDGRVLHVAPVSATEWLAVTDADDATFAAMAAAVGTPAVREEGAAYGHAEPFDRYLWGLRNTADGLIRSWLGVEPLEDFDIDVDEAHAISTGAGTVVAVIDTGVVTTSADLPASTFWSNPGEVCGNRTDDDGNGYVDDCRGWDFVDGDNEPYAGPASSSHGSHIAGTIAAAPNGVGIEGVAPGTKIMDLRAGSGDGSGTFAWANTAAAVRYAADNGADVINASWGGSAASSVLRSAIDHARSRGVLFVSAAGNSGVDLDAGAANYPSGFDLDNIVVVGAAAPDGVPSSFSNTGATQVDLFAPGTGIASLSSSGSYIGMSGTSMAAPHVAAAAALLAADQPHLGATELRERLITTVDRYESFAGRAVAGGHLNAARLLGAIDASAALQVTWGGLDDIRSGQTSAVTVDIAADPSVAEEHVDVHVGVYRAVGDQAFGVLDLPVTVDGAETATGADASVVLRRDVDIAAGALESPAHHEIGLSLPAGSYALLVELVDREDPSIAHGPAAVAYLSVTPTSTTVTTTVTTSPTPTAPTSPTTTTPTSPTGPTTPTTVPVTGGPSPAPTPTPRPADPTPAPTAPTSPSTSPTTVPDAGGPAPDPTSPTSPSPTSPTSPTTPSPTTPTSPGPTTPTSPTTTVPEPGDPSPAPTPGPVTPPTSPPSPSPTTTVPASAPAPRPVTEDGITLSSLAPVTGPSAGGTLVWLTGSGFPEHARVLFGGRAGEVVSATSTRIAVRNPAGTGTVDVTVADHAGNAVTMPGAFRYTSPEPTPGTPPPSPTTTTPSAGTSPTTTAPPTATSPSTTMPAEESPAPGTRTRSRVVVADTAVVHDGLTLARASTNPALAPPSEWPARACRTSTCTATIR